MTPELTALAIAALWQVVMVGAAGAVMNRELGPAFNAGPRDKMPEPSPLLGRLRRAVNNHVENLGLFTIAVVVVTLSGTAGGFTAACAWVFVAARVLYLPAYAFGWSPWRSVIWMVGLLATLAMIFAALFGAAAAA
ncbi:MAPEG family protein [Sinirhodobacter populi]|uniref:MAPEG family protein n=1 Tax=Paenirhodobacter populi TaxID=2306993 RepID=A0A443KHS0_9RHOB|nr:MAPEG family protein [Sinirhodobacter populi]RWR32311.1 MAPEG family protein [Sinirhodobacter populi]